MRFALSTLLLSAFCLPASPLKADGQQPAAAAKPQARAAQPAAAPGNGLAALKQQADAAEARKQAAEKSLSELRNQLKGLLDELRKVQTAKSAAEKTMKSAADKLKKQQAAVTAANTAKQKADAALSAAQKALAAAQKAAADAKAKADAAAKSFAAARGALKKTQAQVTAAKATIVKSADALSKAQQGVETFRPKVVKQQQQLARLSAEALQKRQAIENVLAKQGKFVSFSEKVAPIFARRCLACHNARTAKGRFNMETFASIMKGSESGPVIDTKDPEFSTLIALIEDGSMPKDADPLTKQQIATIKQWVKTGAKLNAGISPEANLATIIPKLPQPAPPASYRVPIPVTAVAFSPDGKTLVSSGYHEILVWDAQNGKLIRRIANVAERVYDIAFSPDGKTIAVAAGTPGQQGEAKLFDAADGKLLADLVTTNDAVFAVAFSPDGKLIAAGGADRAIRVYEVASHKQLAQIEDHADWVMGLAWSPDGKRLASASRDKTSKVFDMTPRKLDAVAIAMGTQSKNLLSGESLATFNSHGEPVYDVAFSPDGKSVVTCGADKQIRIWNPANAKQIRNIGGFGDKVFHVQVTPDGRIFSCSADKTARVNTLANGKAVRTFGGNTDWVYSVAYSAAAKKVATGSYNGEVRIFNVADGKLLAQFIAAPGYKETTVSAKK